jgi:hypothetical protein
MSHNKTPYNETFEYLQQCRRNVFPNVGFLKQLLKYEKILFKENSCSIQDYYPNYDEENSDSKVIKSDIKKLFSPKKENSCKIF